MSELAIKPTRRETLRLVIAAVEKRKREEVAAARNRADAIRVQHQKAQDAQLQAARTYGDQTYKSLLRKITNAIKQDFPGVKAYVYTDFEKEYDKRTGRERIKEGSPVTIRLHVSGTEKNGVDLPAGIMAKIVEEKARAEALWDQYLKANQEAEALSYKASEYASGPQDYKYAKLLEDLIPTLGPDAAEHLDALAVLVEGAVKGKATS